jgi:hypothetical protein
MVDNNTTSMIEESYNNTSDSGDDISSIHDNSIGLKDLDGPERNLSYDHSPKQGQTTTSMFEGTPSRKLSPPRSYIPPMPGSAGLSRNIHVIDKKDSDIGS